VKYFTAILSGILIFICCFIILTLIFSAVLPDDWGQRVVQIGPLHANIPGIIAFILGTLAATHTFRASFSAKTGKLYKKKIEEEQK
jgi:amino acid transporter